MREHRIPKDELGNPIPLPANLLCRCGCGCKVRCPNRSHVWNSIGVCTVCTRKKTAGGYTGTAPSRKPVKTGESFDYSQKRELGRMFRRVIKESESRTNKRITRIESMLSQLMKMKSAVHTK